MLNIKNQLDRNKSFCKLLETKLQAFRVQQLIRVIFYHTTDGDVFPNSDDCEKVKMEV